MVVSQGTGGGAPFRVPSLPPTADQARLQPAAHSTQARSSQPRSSQLDAIGSRLALVTIAHYSTPLAAHARSSQLQLAAAAAPRSSAALSSQNVGSAFSELSASMAPLSQAPPSLFRAQLTAHAHSSQLAARSSQLAASSSLYFTLRHNGGHVWPAMSRGRLRSLPSVAKGTASLRSSRRELYSTLRRNGGHAV